MGFGEMKKSTGEEGSSKSPRDRSREWGKNIKERRESEDLKLTHLLH